jgi:hypothetical protein
MCNILGAAYVQHMCGGSAAIPVKPEGGTDPDGRRFEQIAGELT